jgi:membrane peptidoglycan carboxypeptidase
MLEDNYITFEEYQSAVITSIGFKFNKYFDRIKHPYFVFFVKEYLEKKYGLDLLESQ